MTIRYATVVQWYQSVASVYIDMHNMYKLHNETIYKWQDTG